MRHCAHHRETFRRIQIVANTSLKTLQKLTRQRIGEKLIVQSTTIGLSKGQVGVEEAFRRICASTPDAWLR
jgi:hypothetical protein